MPADVVKVQVLAGGRGGAGVLARCRATLRAEGPRGFYRGFVPAAARQCPVILVQMPLIEAIRAAVGLGGI